MIRFGTTRRNDCHIQITFKEEYLRRLESDAEQEIQTDFLQEIHGMLQARYSDAIISVGSEQYLSFGYFGVRVEAPGGKAKAGQLSQDVNAYIYGAVDQAIRKVTAEV